MNDCRFSIADWTKSEVRRCKYEFHERGSATEPQPDGTGKVTPHPSVR